MCKIFGGVFLIVHKGRGDSQCHGVVHDNGVVHDGKFSVIGSITLVSGYPSKYRVAHIIVALLPVSPRDSLSVNNHHSHVSLPLDEGYLHQTGRHLKPVS